MNETSHRWHQIAPSEFPWDREALAFVRWGLPDYEPYRAWSNLEFIAEDGSIHEIDLLVLCPKGFFLVEIKSWAGTLEGDATTWVLHREGRAHTYDSPLLLANRKARKLAALLKRQKAFSPSSIGRSDINRSATEGSGTGSGGRSAGRSRR